MIEIVNYMLIFVALCVSILVSFFSFTFDILSKESLCFTSRKIVERCELYHRPMHVPEGSLLAVQDLSLQLVPFLVDLALRFRLHKDKFPFSRKHLLQSS